MIFNSLSAQNIVFQEEFDGGILANWTNNPISPDTAALTWEWSADGTAIAALWLDRDGLLSPSIENGCALFNGAYYHSEDSFDSWGAGPFPGPIDIELISPINDCSNASNLILKFNQFFRNKLTVY